jgi:hypothetical protein
MTGISRVSRRREGDASASLPLADEELANQLLCPDGLLPQATKALLKRALGER